MNTPLLIVIAVLVLFSAFFSSAETAFSSLNKVRLKSSETDENKKKIEARSKEIKATGAAIRNSDSMEFAEEVAREDLGMVKPREVIYVDKEKERAGETNEEDSR